MKKSIFYYSIICFCSVVLLIFISKSVKAQVLGKTDPSVKIENAQLGAGIPYWVTIGNTRATAVDDGYYHAPQQMPYYPTASIIWPRVVEVECDVYNNTVNCDGYHWIPKYGRAEYLFILPKKRIVQPVPEVKCCQVPSQSPIIVYKEVPRKPKDE